MAAALGAHDTAIDIRRMTLALRLSGDPQRLDPVARRLGQLAQGRLERALSRARLEGDPASVGETTQELTFIGRLAVHCAGNTAWDDDALASHVARRLVLALKARLSDPDVLRFRDRPDYVAAAAMAIAQGRLAQCWWFGEFDGLQALAASTALRTLILNELSNGTAALARLAESSLAQVIGTLTEGDASRLLAWVATLDTPATPPLLQLWKSAQDMQRHGDTPARWLTALVATERAVPGAMGANGMRLLRGMTALLRRAAGGDLPMLQGSIDRASAQALVAELGDESAWLDKLADSEFNAVLATLQTLQPASRAAATVQCLATPHGGFFLLLARVQRMDWPARFQGALLRRRPDWPQAQRDALCRAIACRIASGALGSTLHGSPLADPAVVAACRLDGVSVDGHEDLAVAALRAAVRDANAPAGEPPTRPTGSSKPGARLPRLLGEAATLVIADLARSLPGLAGSTPAFLRMQALALSAVVQASPEGEDGEATTSLVRLGRAPLDVLLVLSGVKRQRLQLPGIPPIQLQEDWGA